MYSSHRECGLILDSSSGYVLYALTWYSRSLFSLGLTEVINLRTDSATRVQAALDKSSGKL